MLGGETSGSEQKGVMQWTGLELKAKLKWRRVLNKMARLASSRYASVGWVKVTPKIVSL